MSPMLGTRLALSGDPSSSQTEDRSTTGFACMSANNRESGVFTRERELDK